MGTSGNLWEPPGAFWEPYLQTHAHAHVHAHAHAHMHVHALCIKLLKNTVFWMGRRNLPLRVGSDLAPIWPRWGAGKTQGPCNSYEKTQGFRAPRKASGGYPPLKKVTKVTFSTLFYPFLCLWPLVSHAWWGKAPGRIQSLRAFRRTSPSDRWSSSAFGSFV